MQSQSLVYDCVEVVHLVRLVECERCAGVMCKKFLLKPCQLLRMFEKVQECEEGSGTARVTARQPINVRLLCSVGDL